MSNKGIPQTAITKAKISLANKKDYTKVYEKIAEYINTLENDTFPSIVSASLYAGISEKALLAHELRTTENSDIRILLDKIRDKQKEYLMTMGLKNKVNSNIAVLLLRSEHNVKEQPTSLTQNNTFNISPELLAEAIEISRRKK